MPIETYIGMIFLKYRYRLGLEPLCREVADSIAWRRFCRIPLRESVPHPSTLMKITTRCGETAVAGLNEALLAKAAEKKVIKLRKVRADTTVVEANVAYPTDSGLLAKGVARLAGYFLDWARLPGLRGLPTVRAFQRAQGEVALEWLKRRVRWQ